ncbi:peroxiredoxin [Scopulibacillus darangshiensis]|uniref:Peroxiredoxin n=1 Tax=Scopulibacillus darangshiensis TaxID=442528 RepID=A0A4R2P9G7_9BACL|nr:thiol-disulfide oxidoreductase ResA [Scopulibacillus darangshiensis]TCP31690.1 peroxiredoxin [Scopulibacillus darangshiensis]
MADRKKRLIIRTLIILILVAAVGFTIYQIFNKKHVVEIGDTAPDFILTDVHGKKVHLKDFRGKAVVLNFWATWCDPCKREMPYINKVYEKTKNQKDVVILAVNIKESKFAVENFLNRYHIKFPVLMDKKGDVMDAYNIVPIPTTFFIDKDGKVVDKVTETMPSADYLQKKIEKIKP